MLQDFLTNINNNLLFNKDDFLLVAVSGGVDSVVLVDLLHQHKFKWAMAHCNFSLRENDSDEDEKFIFQLSKKYAVRCFSVKFDTHHYAIQHGLSVQMAARDLRYKWLMEIMKTHSFQYLLTAHHLDDNIETLLLNQIRGTGIKGMTGIPEKQNVIVRPLLRFTKESILNYAHSKQLQYREDLSNQKDNYRRNFIRLNVIPLLKKIQPQLHSVFQNNINKFNQTKKYLDRSVAESLNPVIIKEKDLIKIKKENLADISDLHFVLQNFLSDFNFNDNNCYRFRVFTPVISNKT